MLPVTGAVPRVLAFRAIVALVVVWGSPERARADDLYELERAEAAVERLGHRRTSAAAGKRIAFIDLAREEVFTEDEFPPARAPGAPAPWRARPRNLTSLNTFHWLTDEDVIRRELRIHVGDVYDEARVQESMRNLRSLGVFALVRILAVEAPEADSVGLVVYTRDVWSLRTETAFTGVAGSFEGLIQLTERNLFGRGTAVGARLQLAPHSYRVGEFYADRRLFGAKLALEESFDVILNRAAGDPEGSAGYLSLGRPFYTLEDRWTWTLAGSYLVQVARPLQRGEISGRSRADGTTCDPALPDCLRAVWDDRSVATSASVTYRRGHHYKQSFGLGAAFSDRAVEPNAETALAPGEEDDFQRVVLPRVRRQAYPFVSYGLGLPRYAVFENLGTFGQSETVATGPSVGAKVRFPIRSFGSSSDSVIFSGDLGYVLAGGRALLDASVSAESRLEEGDVVDQSLSATLRGATPPWLLGRLVLRTEWIGRRHDTANEVVTVGGANGLRGYLSDEFQVISGNRLVANLEYRTLPIEIASVHLGGVLFYDVGSVYKSTDRVPIHQSIGVGLRTLFLQINRNVFRFDFGVPVDGDGFSVLFSYGSTQAIALTPADE